MALTKVTGKGITCSAVTEDKLGTSAVTTNKIGPNAVTSAKIQDGQVTSDDLASTLDLTSKTVTLPCASVSAANLASTLDLSSKTITLPGSVTNNIDQNIALLGFKMAVNDGLTVFNLVDGVVDEFNDESGTDEAEGSNDYYCGTSDFYQNISFSPVSISAGFTTTTITEPDTSSAGTNPGIGVGTGASFTVPAGLTSATVKVWGAGGGGGGYAPAGGAGPGGGGGFVSGNLAVTCGQTLGIFTAEGGELGWNGSGGGSGGLWGNHPTQRAGYDRGGGNDGQSGGYAGGGGGGGFVTTQTSLGSQGSLFSLPTSALIAGGGGGGGNPGADGGAGGGLGGDAGGTTTEQTSGNGNNGGGGDQEQGGDRGPLQSISRYGQNGGLFFGGDGHFCGGIGGGGGGYYGGGGASYNSTGHAGGGGGSSYNGNPNISCGATEEGSEVSGGGTADPAYVAGTNEGVASPTAADGEDGYVLITGCGSISSTASTTIVSEPFTSSSVATSARIVVFEENIDTPTLNTDIIASISRDAGVTFTNATLTDSGYVTGSSGQRILTGQADISGQPSGQSMRWKLALANNQVKIHGVALQWS